MCELGLHNLVDVIRGGHPSSSLVPRPPFNTARGKGGLVNIVQHFCRSAEFRRDNLIG